MSLQFSDDGPEFPNALINDLARGEVVFLCGAGISAPQMPGFDGLVDQIYERNGWERKPGEEFSYRKERYEEGLGTLARRLADPAKLYNTVAAILKPLKRPDLRNHQTLLRLSRQLDNRPTIVTTNFDTMFERAVRLKAGATAARECSVAGQSLPAPGSPDFAGIIHLHGRLEDAQIGLQRTPLILTSAEYGDAYMRSGWASRFLFDVTRCRTIVLVGYSANDAPVRYFLNVLEADRDRFSDLRTVYALAAVNGSDRQSAQNEWSAVAVRTMPYCTREKDAKGGPHAALWDDLAHLAGLIEKPKSTRRAKVKEIFARPLDDSTQRDKDILAWAFNRRRDLFDIAIANIQDPAWLNLLVDRKLLQERDVPWLFANWCARRWTDQAAIDAAIAWSDRWGSPFRNDLEMHLMSSTGSPRPEPWRTAWRLLARSSASERRELGVEAYHLKTIFDRGEAMDLHRRRAVQLMTPVLTVRKCWRLYEEKTEGPPTNVGDILRADMKVIERGANELIPSLLEPTAVARVAELATEELRSGLHTARDAGLISGRWDSPDSDVPSIEEHRQNEHRHGFLLLIRVLIRSLDVIAITNVGVARKLAVDWSRLGSRLGPRLMLHAMRRPNLFTPFEAVDGLLTLNNDDFWSIRREWVLLAVERASGGTINQIDKLVDRIITEAQGLFHDIGVVEEGQTDWRPRARDQAAWLRLSAISKAGCLNASGKVALTGIKRRQPHLDRDFEDRDLFSSYTSGVRTVTGDPAPLMEAEPDERLNIAHSLQTSQDFDDQASWPAYSATDPEGALETLLRGDRDKDASLWSGLFNAITNLPQDDPVKRNLLHKAFRYLECAEDGFLKTTSYGLVAGFICAEKLGVDLRGDWWDRLWRNAEAHEERGTYADGSDFYGRVINSSGGRLTEHLLLMIDQRRKAGAKPSRNDLTRLKQVVMSETPAGHFGRGALVHDFGFVWSLGVRRVQHGLLARLELDTPEGVALRIVLTEYAQLQPGAFRAAKAAILRGIKECDAHDTPKSNVAAKLLYPVLSMIRCDPDADWGLISAEVRQAMSGVQPGVREGAAFCMQQWLGQMEQGPTEGWRGIIGPLFELTWPEDRNIRDEATSSRLAALCVQAEDAFPEALNTIKPYLAPFERDWASVHFLEISKAPERFPQESLELVWSLCGPPSQSVTHDIGAVLDRIAEAKPEIAIDRRFQWLEDRAFRR
jgi:hypothetical protein